MHHITYFDRLWTGQVTVVVVTYFEATIFCVGPDAPETTLNRTAKIQTPVNSYNKNKIKCQITNKTIQAYVIIIVIINVIISVTIIVIINFIIIVIIIFQISSGRNTKDSLKPLP